MSDRAGPAWLAELQGRFAAAMRAPLDRSRGAVRYTASGSASDLACDTGTADAPAALRDLRAATPGEAAAGLAVYNRQYWFRLLGVLQAELPLTARLVGHEAFRGLAAAFLRDHAPCSYDVSAAADGFASALAERAPDERGCIAGVERDALLEAAALDEAWRVTFRAPPRQGFRPSAAHAARLSSLRLRPAPGWVVFDERWPFVELRRALVRGPDPANEVGPGGGGAIDAAGPLPLPARLDVPRSWLLVHLPGGAGQVALEPPHAALLRELRRASVGEALARVEALCSPEARAALPERVRWWLARSVDLALWSGVDDDVP